MGGGRRPKVHQVPGGSESRRGGERLCGVAKSPPWRRALRFNSATLFPGHGVRSAGLPRSLYIFCVYRICGCFSIIAVTFLVYSTGFVRAKTNDELAGVFVMFPKSYVGRSRPTDILLVQYDGWRARIYSSAPPAPLLFPLHNCSASPLNIFSRVGLRGCSMH